MVAVLKNHGKSIQIMYHHQKQGSRFNLYLSSDLLHRQTYRRATELSPRILFTRCYCRDVAAHSDGASPLFKNPFEGMKQGHITCMIRDAGRTQIAPNLIPNCFMCRTSTQGSY